ncbi:hypothetical protein AVEN_209258-1 [Araneus ventricosus]|uniref:Uncharacterized protein n=1 Tax=Araneus ventricosus TaxID=182803 RepID=A0A4Y2W861_ARAVE|nr:hypothetical protein AVEN_209258-1 [Araneus ventricosus]
MITFPRERQQKCRRCKNKHGENPEIASAKAHKGGLVVRPQLQDWRVAGSKPDSTEDPPCDEKWIIYNNVEQKQPQSYWSEPPSTIQKPNIYFQKNMLYCWWDWKSIVYCKLVPANETINSVKYSNQLDNLKQTNDQKRPELANCKVMVFHQDNSWSPGGSCWSWLGCLTPFIIES